MHRRLAICVLATITLVSAACGDDARPSAASTRPSAQTTTSLVRDAPSPASTTTPAAELVTAVTAYVRARNGTDPQAYRDSMCASVRDAAAIRQPKVAVVVDRVDDVRVDGRTATVTVDLGYSVTPGEILHSVRGVEWTFLREGDQWKQCSPPAFGSATG
ncbi:hypothetical protein GCM10007298_09170 [Williamsia phyllosphaerae]|uniref:Nuclear transport factor 2 family protein n=2 Tax=Williamsia phyllosphaerae TaxID=885042 RepID=A0ABQ1UF69_9NOCA|nr:hypothetical protein GCM10007298_09170 [Williamsia phyllosphaerae]